LKTDEVCSVQQAAELAVGILGEVKFC